MLKLSLSLVAPALASQLWLAKTVWTLKEQVNASIEIRRQMQVEIKELRMEILGQLVVVGQRLENLEHEPDKP